MSRMILYSAVIFLAGGFFYGLFFLTWVAQLFSFLPAFNLDFLTTANILFLVAGVMALVAFTRRVLQGTPRKVHSKPILKPEINVGMTAYNDELSIGPSVKEFKALKEVKDIIVVDNNCVDKTAVNAKAAGAIVIKEPVQGYGAACMRALKSAHKGGKLVCLVEGDQTYVASDIKKLLAYIENADMVVGTRTTTEIVETDSQVTPFIQIGNVFVAKLLQLRFWGVLRLTDVGCTYRLIRSEALDKIIDKLSVRGNHFCVDILITALKNDLKVIECPIVFRKRVGESKGVGSSIPKGLINGLQMIWLIIKS